MGDHAARALNRFIGANPEDIKTAPFTEDYSAMRAYVKAKLDKIMTTDTAQTTSLTAEDTPLPVEATPTRKPQCPLILLSKSPHTREHKKYLEEIIQTALPKVRVAFIRGGIEIPSDDEILQAMITTERFTPEQIEALMRNIQVSGLIVLPPEMKSFSAYAGFLNANKKTRGQHNVYTCESRKMAFMKQNTALEAERRGKPAGYLFGIGEMMQEPANRKGKLKDIVGKWEESDLAKLIRTVTPREYVVLQAQAQYLLDINGWTILAEANAPHRIIGDDKLVSGANGDSIWSGGNGVGFGVRAPEVGYSNARVRPVVVG